MSSMAAPTGAAPTAGVAPGSGVGDLNNAPSGGLSAQTLDFSGSPYGGVYAEQANAAMDAYNTAVNQVNQERSQLYNTAGFNADGSVNGLNLTGQYQQLQRAEGQSLENQQEADASRNIGSAGIGAQNTSNLRYQNSVDQANFANNFTNQNQALTTQQTSAYNTYQNALMQLQQQAIADALMYQSFPLTGSSTPSGSTVPSGSGGAGGGSAAGQAANQAYANTPTGQAAIKQVKANPASAGSSGAAGVLTGQTKKNYQAIRDAT